MSITKNEKEKLYEEFKMRLQEESVSSKPTTMAYKNLHNLEIAREHFKTREDKLRDQFDAGLWMYQGLNWPDWNFIVRLVYHAYGVSTAGNILEAHIKDANNLAIKLVDDVFDANILYLEKGTES